MPRPTGLTKWRSPDSVSPASGAAATPHSIMGETSTASRMPATPFLHGHGRPLPRRGDDVEVVHQAPGARHADAQAPRRRVPVLQIASHVRNTTPLVAGGDDQAIHDPVQHGAAREISTHG